MGVVTNQQLVVRRRQARRSAERAIREAERRSPEVAERRARIRVATRVGSAALKSREQAQGRLVDALRLLIGEGLSIREAADRIGLGYHQARQLLRLPSDP